MQDEEFKKAGTRKVVVEVSYNDIDALINRHFPNMLSDYEIVAYEEWNNDESHDYTLNGKVSEYDLKCVHRMQETGKWKHYSTSHILNYLCSLGVIEPASYLIDVSW